MAVPPCCAAAVPPCCAALLCGRGAETSDELAAVERAASATGMPLSTFIRQAALGAASPLDVRAARARAEAIHVEARKLVALLHGDVA